MTYPSGYFYKQNLLFEIPKMQNCCKKYTGHIDFARRRCYNELLSVLRIAPCCFCLRFCFRLLNTQALYGVASIYA